MGYFSKDLKDKYNEQCKEQRVKNLIKLRVDIAKIPKQADFIDMIGFTKNDLSKLENGHKNLSLYQINAYKACFKEHFGLNLSVDFLMGYTDVIENQSMDIAKDLGLSDDAIRVFREMSKAEHDTFNKLSAEDDLLHLLLLELWKYANNSTHIDIKIHDHITESTEKIADKREIDNIRRYQATDVFNSVLDSMKRAFNNSVD